MKIVHTSDIYLGKQFTEFNQAGDKIRAGVKTTFSKIIDYTINQKADLLIIAGNLFNDLNISRNLQAYIASELGRLESIPAVIMPGITDNYTDGSFWKIWQKIIEYENVNIIDNPKKPYVVLSNLNCAVYGIFNPDNGQANTDKLSHHNAEYHIGVMCSKMDSARPRIENAGIDFHYIALGGEPNFMDLSSSGVKAAYCGSPENLGFEATGGGNIAVIEIDQQKNITVSANHIGSFIWKNEQIKAKEILTNEDLTERLIAIAGDDPSNTALRVTLSGLTLFEAYLSPELVEEQMKNTFLCLDIVDTTRVLPDNVSEVKVSEKTLLGQYIKVMATELSSADEEKTRRLAKSAKTGLALLQGREIW